MPFLILLIEVETHSSVSTASDETVISFQACQNIAHLYSFEKISACLLSVMAPLLRMGTGDVDDLKEFLKSASFIGPWLAAFHLVRRLPAAAALLVSIVSGEVFIDLLAAAARANVQPAKLLHPFIIFSTQTQRSADFSSWSSNIKATSIKCHKRLSDRHSFDNFRTWMAFIGLERGCEVKLQPENILKVRGSKFYLTSYFW